MVGDGVGCWVRVIMVCCSCLTVILGVHLFDTCFVVKRVL